MTDRLLELSMRELPRLMSEISEDHYCAGWLDELEYTLWTAVRFGDFEFGFSHIGEERISELRQLSSDIGGWFAYRDGEERFVPIDEWRRQYLEWASGKPDRLRDAAKNYAKWIAAGETDFMGEPYEEKIVHDCLASAAEWESRVAQLKQEQPA